MFRRLSRYARVILARQRRVRLRRKIFYRGSILCLIPAFAGMTLMFLGFSTPVFAAGESAPCIITIKKVELKNIQGSWLTIVEPDHAVDPSNEEPGFSFFNDGRVPIGKYVNFRLLFDEITKTSGKAGNFGQNSVREITMSGAEDLLAPLDVRKGSFIAVWFKLNLNAIPKEVTEVSVTVDDAVEIYPKGKIGIAELTKWPKKK